MSSPAPSGWGAQPQYGWGSQPPQPSSSTGAAAWVIGSISLLFPIIGFPLMILIGLDARGRGIEPGRTIGTRAANWGLTYVIACVLLLFVLQPIASAVMGLEEMERYELLLSTPAFLFLALTLFHVVFCIVAAVKARSGKALSFCGVPFFKVR